jgi:hypothetical protein
MMQTAVLLNVCRGRDATLRHKLGLKQRRLPLGAFVSIVVL